MSDNNDPDSPAFWPGDQDYPTCSLCGRFLDRDFKCHWHLPEDWLVDDPA